MSELNTATQAFETAAEPESESCGHEVDESRIDLADPDVATIYVAAREALTPKKLELFTKARIYTEAESYEDLNARFGYKNQKGLVWVINNARAKVRKALKVRQRDDLLTHHIFAPRWRTDNREICKDTAPKPGSKTAIVQELYLKWKAERRPEDHKKLMHLLLEECRLTGIKYTPDGGDLRVQCINAATLGLADALTKYDEEKGASLLTYARIRIQGAILDQLREYGQHTREASRRTLETEEHIGRMISRSGGNITSTEIVEALKSVGVSNRIIQNAFKLAADADSTTTCQPRYSHNDYFDDENYPSEPPDPETWILETERRKVVFDASSRLPAKERQVVALYYGEDLHMREIAAIMRLTEGRISQLHSQAICRLRGSLAEQRKTLIEGTTIKPRVPETPPLQPDFIDANLTSGSSIDDPAQLIAMPRQARFAS